MTIKGRGSHLAYKKGAKRYRYYVVQSLGMSDQKAKALRWPAQELEAAVIGGLSRLLTRPSRLVELMGNLQANEVTARLKQAAVLSSQMFKASSSGRIEILKRIVSRVTIRPGQVDIAYVPMPSGRYRMCLLIVP